MPKYGLFWPENGKLWPYVMVGGDSTIFDADNRRGTVEYLANTALVFQLCKVCEVRPAFYGVDGIIDPECNFCWIQDGIGLVDYD